jgi:hypothetical protein
MSFRIIDGDPMKKFKLIGRPSIIFNVVKEYLAAKTIPSVKGISECGKYQTYARIADVVILK